MNELLITILVILRPALEVFLSVAVPALVTVLAAQAIRFLGIKSEDQKIKVEADLRNALHEAAQNALLFAMTKYGIKSGGNNATIDIGWIASKAGSGDPGASELMGKVLNEAVEYYLMPKMPDSITKLKATRQDLEDIVLSKIPRV